jgi:hypothetical protein
MKVKALTLDDDGLPDRLTVEMTRDEAILIATHVGNLTPSTEVSTPIWDALSGEVFNRYWEDGLDDARRSFRANVTRTA